MHALMSRALPFPFKPAAWTVRTSQCASSTSPTARGEKNNRHRHRTPGLHPCPGTLAVCRLSGTGYTPVHPCTRSICPPPPARIRSTFKDTAARGRTNSPRAALLEPQPPITSVHARAEASIVYLFAGPVSVAVIRAGSCPWRRGEQHFIFPSVCRTERRAQPRQPGDVTQRRMWEEIGAARRDHTNPSARAKLFIHLIARVQPDWANTHRVRYRAPYSWYSARALTLSLLPSKQSHVPHVSFLLTRAFSFHVIYYCTWI